MINNNVIVLKDVSIFQGNNLILDEVNIEVKPSQFIYLIGKTGSGKSSLLKTLYAELRLRDGAGEVSEYDLRTISEQEIPYLRRKLGIVFQDFQLLTDRNIYENLIFVLKATGWTDDQLMKARIKEVLAEVGLATKDYKMPHELSGGEQQRVVIARALLNSPLVMLADEPTGNLDPELSDEIMVLLHRIASEGTAVIMATHDYRLIQKFPAMVFRCENGKVSESKI
jgi:cell division transport system ATP-binding protein